MAYPPTPPPNTRTNATPLPENHAGDHNDISDALTDIINELGTDPAGGVVGGVTARLDGATDYVLTGTGVVIGTSPTAVATLAINAKNAGMGLIFLVGTTTAAGVTFGGGGGSAFTVHSVTGATALLAANSASFHSVNNTAPCTVLTWPVSLAAGVNTITFSLARVNSDASGGTITLDTGARFGIIGMF